MTRLSRRLDPGIIAATAMTLPALSTLLHRTLPRGGDLLLHFYRLVALDSCMRRGLLYPRWMPDLVYGYGYPLFHFYAPLSTYVAEALHLVGLSFIMSVRAVCALTLLGLGVGMYLWVRDSLGSPRAALLAAVAAVYAPYVLSTPLSRGSLSDGLALALVPFAFWMLDRVSCAPTTPRLATASLVLAALFLSHNVTALICCPVFVLYIVASALERGKHRSAVYPLGALVLGLLLSAFFWFPALADKGWTRLDLFIASPEYDYRRNFLSVGYLFRFPAPAEVGLMNPPAPHHVNPVAVLLGLLGVLWAWRSRLEGRLRLASLWVSGLFLLYLTLSPSSWVWARIPFLPVIQFPSRLLGPASILLAPAAAVPLMAAGETRAKRGWGWRLATVVLLLALVVPSIPVLYPLRQGDLPREPTLLDVSAYQESGPVGTTSAGEYLPKMIKVRPRGPAFAAMDQGANLGAKLDRSVLPPGAQLEEVSSTPLAAQWRISTPVPFHAVVHTFYFPGWQARLDGRPLPITPTPSTGLISFAVPSGEHRLAVSYGATPVTRLANTLSLIGAGLTLALLLRQRLGGPATAWAGGAAPRLARADAVMCCVLGLCLFASKLAYLDRTDNPWRRGYDGQVPGAAKTINVDLSAKVRLLAADPLPTLLYPGSTAPLVLYWAALEPLSKSYSVSVQILDEQANKVAQEDHYRPGDYPTVWWRVGEYNRDQYRLDINPSAPPGRYSVIVALYAEDGERLIPAPDIPGAQRGAVEIQELHILPAGKP